MESAESPHEDALNEQLAKELELAIATSGEPIMKYFRWAQLKSPELQRRSALFGTLALQILNTTPRKPRTLGCVTQVAGG